MAKKNKCSGNCAIVCVHGIGKHTGGFSKKLKSLIDKRGVSYAIWKEAVWGTVVQDDQNELQERLNITSELKKSIVDFLGDAVAYQSTCGVYVDDKNDEIKKVVSQTLREAAKETTNGHVVVVAHSLGSVITSDVIWDMSNNSEWPEEIKRITFVTMGSPLAMWAVRWGIDDFNKPIKPDLWLNIYNKRDPIGTNLKDLNKAYKKVVNKDVSLKPKLLERVPVVGNLLSHVNYWIRKEVVDIVEICLKN